MLILVSKWTTVKWINSPWLNRTVITDADQRNNKKIQLSFWKNLFGNVICRERPLFRVNYLHAAISMMTSSNGNIFRVTGRLCGEFTGPMIKISRITVVASYDGNPYTWKDGLYTETGPCYCNCFEDRVSVDFIFCPLQVSCRDLTMVIGHQRYSLNNGCRMTSPIIWLFLFHSKLNYIYTKTHTEDMPDIIITKQSKSIIVFYVINWQPFHTRTASKLSGHVVVLYFPVYDHGRVRAS